MRNGYALIEIWEHEIEAREAWVLVKERVWGVFTCDDCGLDFAPDLSELDKEEG